MYDIIVTEPGVLKLLAALDVKKSTGPDGISPYNECREPIAPVLAFLFNQSLGTWFMVVTR